MGSIPGRGTKIPQVVWCSQKKKKKKKKKKRETRRGHVTRWADRAAMQLQAEQLAAEAASLGQTLPQRLQGTQPCHSWIFRLPASRTGREQVSVVLSHQVCGSSHKEIKDGEKEGTEGWGRIRGGTGTKIRGTGTPGV